MAALTDTIRTQNTDFFGRARATLRARMARRAEFNRVYGELIRMTDRELNDIGIGRADINTIARQAAGY